MTLFLAHNKLIGQGGVRALISLRPDLTVVSAAADGYDGLLSVAEYCATQVFVTHIRMPPTSRQDGTDAAKEVRERHPRTFAGVVLPHTMAAPPARGAAELRPAHVVRAE